AASEDHAGVRARPHGPRRRGAAQRRVPRGVRHGHPAMLGYTGRGRRRYLRLSDPRRTARRPTLHRQCRGLLSAPAPLSCGVREVLPDGDELSQYVSTEDRMKTSHDYRRIAVMGGVYNNWAALDALLDDARRKDVEAVFCLGDMGGFGPHPDRVF